MTPHHLLPNELDLLVDGESRMDLASLRAHLAECGDCATRFEALRAITGTVEALPHFTPNLRFVDRVMTKVQVAEPWYIGLAARARRLLPARGPVRIVAGVAVATVGLVVSGSVLWLALSTDFARWTVGVAAEGGRQALRAGAGDVATRALGPDGTAALTTGGTSVLALAGVVIAIVAIGAVLGFRRLVAVARASRS